MKRLPGFLLILFVATMAGCYYDTEEKLYPQISTGCNLTNVTFSGTVSPILQASCYTCHSNSNAASSGDGIRLQNYSDVLIQVKNGKLMGSVKHAGGFSAMPKGGGKLTECEISQLKKWIDNNTPNN